MRKSVNPVVVAIVAVMAVVVLTIFFYRSLQPAYYLPSPGVGGRPARGAPAYAKAPGAPPDSSPIVPPSGSRAGDPNSVKHSP